MKDLSNIYSSVFDIVIPILCIYVLSARKSTDVKFRVSIAWVRLLVSADTMVRRDRDEKSFWVEERGVGGLRLDRKATVRSGIHGEDSVEERRR